jgi:cytochrome P450
MKTMPTRKRIPFLTDLLEFRKMTTDPMGYCEDMVKKYGDVCHVQIPGAENYFIHDPEIIKEVLVTQAGKFNKSRLYRAMKRFLGEGLLTSDGTFHHQQRKLATPAFHRQRIHDYSTTMVSCTQDEIKNWQAGDVVDVSQAMTNITLQIVTNTLFSSKIEPAKIKRVSDIVGQLLETAGKIFQNPVYLLCLENNINLPIIKKLSSLRAEIDTIIYDIITSYRASASSERHDLLSMLIESKDEESSEGMTDEQIRDEVMTVFLAGHETTATALSWTWYLLGTHPEIKNSFYQEINEKIGHRIPTADDYQSLALTKNIFKETLRLYPPAWTFAREAKEDIEIQGYYFPKGSALCSILYIMHRNEKYFENPNAFIPKRWDEEKIKDLPKYVYFPFGGGNRMCIGEGFAWMEGILILATIALQFRLELPKDFRTVIHPAFTLRPKDNIVMKVSRL